jgi:hypothetical protein
MVLPIMRTQQIESTSRAALSPREFAASCGKHPTWAYRLLYANKIRAITDLGRILIPASELERVLNLAEPYNPRPKRQRETDDEGKV